MKIVSIGLAAHYASGNNTLAKCLKMTLRDATVLAATTHDQDLTIDSVTYLASSGGTMSDVENTSSLAVNNGEMKGMLNLDSINEADLRAGKYDYATISVFEVNYADLTQGPRSVMDGWIGEVTRKRNTYSAELRGLVQALSRTIINLATPACHNRLGDAVCGVDLTGNDGDSPPHSFTVTGSIDGVNPDNATLTDAARTEPGPAGGVSVTGVSNANPGVVTVATALTVPNGSAITISGVTGMLAINGVTIVRNLAADGLSFDLGIDTSDTAVYPAYAGGGTVTPAGNESGWFDYGVITFTSGLNDGLSMEVKTYVPGQMTLQLPMPYQVSIGDGYSMVAGCNKLITTCHLKFAHVPPPSGKIGFTGRPYVPGTDKLVQVGRRT